MLGCAQRPWLVMPKTVSSGRAQIDMSLLYLLRPAVTSLQEGKSGPSECSAGAGASECMCEIIT